MYKGLRTTALSVSRATRSRLFPDGTRLYLSDPAYMTSCIRPEVRLALDQRVLGRLVIVAKIVDYYV